jgi:hypothetical protein
LNRQDVKNAKNTYLNRQDAKNAKNAKNSSLKIKPRRDGEKQDLSKTTGAIRFTFKVSRLLEEEA